MPKIKMVLQHYCRRRDIYGNTYWLHKVTNTNTGHSLWWESPHSSNARSAVAKAGYDNWQDIMECGEVELPARDFDRKVKNLKEYDNLMWDSCQDPKIVKAISRLRRKKQ